MTNTKINNDELEKVIGGQGEAPHICCPNCGEIIYTSKEQLITPGSLVCTKCGLRLDVDTFGKVF